MARGPHDDPDEDDDSPAPSGGLSDHELPDPSDMDSGDEPGLDVCPYCRKMINEDAPRCHHCGNYISREDAPSNSRPWVIAVVVLILLAGFIGCWSYGGF